jgi:hypothetical protein
MILKITCAQQAPVSVDVAQWNYLDAEHLQVVHSGYADVQILFEDGHNSLTKTRVKVPLIPFLRLDTVMFVSFLDSSTQVTYGRQFGVWSRTTIRCTEVSSSETRIEMTYEFELNGWKTLLAPYLRRGVPKWNKKVWMEDLPLKIRRQWVLDNGFKDFQGFKNSTNIKARVFYLPMARPIDSPVNSSPLHFSTRRKSNIHDLS